MHDERTESEERRTCAAHIHAGNAGCVYFIYGGDNEKRRVVTEYSLAAQCTIYAFMLGQMVGKQQERARRKSSQHIKL